MLIPSKISSREPRCAGFRIAVWRARDAHARVLHDVVERMAPPSACAIMPGPAGRRCKCRTPRLSTMAAGELVLCLHFNQAAGRALEFELQAVAAIELRRRGGGRYHDLDAAVVELVDEHDEAARRVLIRRRELRHVGDEQGAVQPRELD